MHQGFSGEAKRAVEVLYIPLKHKIIRIDGFAPPPSRAKVRGRYSILGRKFWSEKIDTWWRLLASRLDETTGRELKHQYLQ